MQKCCFIKGTKTWRKNKNQDTKNVTYKAKTENNSAGHFMATSIKSNLFWWKGCKDANIGFITTYLAFWGKSRGDKISGIQNNIRVQKSAGQIYNGPSLRGIFISVTSTFLKVCYFVRNFVLLLPVKRLSSSFYPMPYVLLDLDLDRQINRLIEGR